MTEEKPKQKVEQQHTHNWRPKDDDTFQCTICEVVITEQEMANDNEIHAQNLTQGIAQ